MALIWAAAAMEAAQRTPKDAGWLVATRSRLIEHRGPQHRRRGHRPRLLTLVYYGLRDGHIRALTRPAQGVA